MENHHHHVPRWSNVQKVPESHIFPMGIRPGEEQIPLCNTIPIIDLASSYKSNSHKLDSIQNIIKASQEYGFFQVTNHGVSEDVINEAVEVLEELFNLPVDEISKEANENGWVYMGSTSLATKLGAHLWRDNLKHPCHPLDQSMQYWPLNPKRYRDVMGAYVVEIRRLSLRILELISQGLGFEEGYLGGISQVQFLTASNYPTCPDPSLTLGLLSHFDHSLITILFQGSGKGLQVLKDGNWIGVDVLPNAFVVNIGTQVEIISNGKLRSSEHRVVTNKEEARTSITSFINPNPDCIIEPAERFVDDATPPLYQPLSFKDFVTVTKPFGPFTDHVVQNGLLSKINA